MPETPGVLELTIPDQWKAAPLALIEAGTIGLAEGPIRPVPTGEHWLRFDGATRAVIGCHCGFVADEADCGWGDSVVAHLLEVGAAVAQANAVPPVPERAPMRPRTTSNPDLWGKR